MASLLSNLVNNLTEGIHRTKCKYKYDNKKCKRVELNTNFVNPQVLHTQTLKVI